MKRLCVSIRSSIRRGGTPTAGESNKLVVNLLVWSCVSPSTSLCTFFVVGTFAWTVSTNPISFWNFSFTNTALGIILCAKKLIPTSATPSWSASFRHPTWHVYPFGGSQVLHGDLPSVSIDPSFTGLIGSGVPTFFCPSINAGHFPVEWYLVPPPVV